MDPETALSKLKQLYEQGVPIAPLLKEALEMNKSNHLSVSPTDEVGVTRFICFFLIPPIFDFARLILTKNIQIELPVYTSLHRPA